ncbi:hypothetical protein [Schaalia odontolytica]|uniref:hypothetical protein n=1 Tax=Schaalia odontolytica TaxID=1660 RepID=UPI00210C23A0|nr:hypothetical protein [Schaalia odontolytica]MCQ5281470.1 hypothetical protein [Schaalia odontolytica]
MAVASFFMERVFMSDKWVPLSVRAGRRLPFKQVEDLPEFMWLSLLDWAEGVFCSVDVVRRVERKLRIYSGVDKYSAQTAYQLLCSCQYDSSVALDVIDFLLETSSANPSDLEEILSDVGHVFRVAPEGDRLVYRLQPEVWSLYEEVTRPDDQASGYMQNAWALAFGREPDFGEAWALSVKAVEAILCPLVSPEDAKPTLGKSVGVLRDTPNRWSCLLPDREYRVDGRVEVKRGLDVFVDIVAAIGYQPGRHGGTEIVDVDGEVARCITLQAATVLGWVREGCLSRKEE